MNTMTDKNLSRMVLTVMGLIQGSLLYLVTLYLDSHQFFTVFSWTFLTILFFALQMAWRPVSIARYVLGALLIAGLFALSFAYHDLATRVFLSRILSFQLTIACYIILIFYFVYCDENCFRFPYRQLFLHSWDTIFIFLLALLFTGLCWLVIELWQGLFTILQIKIFQTIFHSSAFIRIATPTFFGFGIALSKELRKVLTQLRSICLAISYVLFIPIGLVSLVFFILLPFRIYLFYDMLYGISSLLFGIVFINIMVVNGVIQDGTCTAPYNKWLRWSFNALFLLLPIVVLLSAYPVITLTLRYGLISLTVYLMMIIALLLAYAVCYAWAVFINTDRWLQAITRFNPYLAIAVSIVFILQNTPILTPSIISAHTQIKQEASR